MCEDVKKQKDGEKKKSWRGFIRDNLGWTDSEEGCREEAGNLAWLSRGRL